MGYLDNLEKDIEELTIQGATDVALATLEGIKTASQNDVAFMKSTGERLAYARPTESLAQNAVRFIFSKKNQPVDYYLSKIEQYRELIKEAKTKMAKEGAKLIKEGGVYLTHCHSSTVTSMFIKAYKQGKKFAVIATETRPKFQGRITVKELLEAGIKDVTLIIDDAAFSLLVGKTKVIGAVFIGADLLTQKGFVNKIGSLAISHGAKIANVPLYCLSILLKFDPRPFSYSLLEVRSKEEVWLNAPKNLKIYSPAFDFVPFDKKMKLITEKGVINKKNIKRQVQALYPFLF